jgi:hypothetical protein
VGLRDHFALTSVQTQALLRILTGVIRLYQQQAEKSDHKRTWADISNVCTDIKYLHAHTDLVLGAEEPKTRSEGGLGEIQRSEGGLGKLQRSDVKSLHLHPVKIGCKYLNLKQHRRERLKATFRAKL